MKKLLMMMGATASLMGCGEFRSDARPEILPETLPKAASKAPAESNAPAESKVPAINDGLTVNAAEITGDDAVVRFSDILDQYRALNTRLEDVTARLQLANAPLCSQIVRDPGYTVHTLSDYPAQLQQVARSFLSVDEGLSVRTVRAGGPAQLAGIAAGDRLVGVNGRRFAGGLTQRKFYERVTQTAFESERATLTIARPIAEAEPNIMSFELRPQNICGFPAHVVFDETVNGHTDGSAIWITSELMRTVDDDVNLALIVAHEMAHAMAGHVQLTPTDEERKSLELMADSMALVMLARADFDLGRAISYWTRADNPQRLSQSRSETHPSITQRLQNFEAAQRAVKTAQREGRALDFSILPPPAL